MEFFFARQTDGLVSTALKFAAPVLLIFLLVDLGLGLVTRAAEKLEPTSVALLTKGALTMLVLALSIGVFVAEVAEIASRSSDRRRSPISGQPCNGGIAGLAHRPISSR